MKIALLGYGKMGHEIEKIAVSRGHEIVLTIDIQNQQENTADNLKKADVAIDFSTPGSAFGNILKCFDAGTPVVCGTTGWLDKMAEVKEICQRENRTLFYASNYSMGVNVFFALNRYLADMMNKLTGYDVQMTEIHHIHKLDAPSGTAITLANELIEKSDLKQKWELNAASGPGSLRITAIREGEVPGTHIITWNSEVDQIEIKHEAFSRKGFALGAVLAAEFIRDKKGIYSMKDLMGSVIS